MTVRVFPGFVGPREREAIAAYARRVRQYLLPNGAGPHRYFQFLAQLPEIVDEIWQLEYRVWDATGFTSAERDDKLPHYLSVNEPGAAIHLHTDPGRPGCVNARFNLMIDRPVGGEPVVDEAIVPVQTGDAWTFVATTHRHRSLPVVEGLRIVVSYGFQIPTGDARLVALGLIEPKR